jgi:hypothetical protein
MRLSESLGRNVYSVTPGAILNKFKGHPRRNTLFFEDIIANYVKTCEDAGFSTEILRMGQEWVSTLTKELMIPALRHVPPVLFTNLIWGRVWVNIGMVSYIRAKEDGNLTILNTMEEVITRLIGKNHISIGGYMGVFNILYGCHFDCKSATQSRESCEYVFERRDEKFDIKSKTKNEYLKLNSPGVIKGNTLKNILKNRTLLLKEKNRIYFRGKSVTPMENTILHIFGNYSILMDKIPEISYNFFKDIIEPDTSSEKKLRLIKTLLSAMGYGVINIIVEDDRLLFRIKNPPYGMQIGEDNWDFLIYTIQGYLWLINDKFLIEKIKVPTRDSNVLEASFVR